VIDGVFHNQSHKKSYLEEYMMNLSNKKAVAFKGVVTLFAGALLATLVFTGCPQSNAGGGNQSGKKIEEGVWKMLSSKTVKDGKTEEQTFPLTQKQGEMKITMQPYFCLSDGKLYTAMQMSSDTIPEANGIFKNDEMWDKAYTYANNTITLQDLSHIPFTVNGDKATSITSKGKDSMTMTFERVSSPTVAEIKAAKAR
jgi:hypothetical protein